MVNDSTEIELEVALPDTIGEDEISSLDWIELGSLTTYETLRTEWDNILGITGETGAKEGMLYKDALYDTDNDSYLGQAISLKEFVEFASDEDNYNALVDAVRNAFVDSDELTDQQLFSVGLNAYFNLLPMADESESHANDFVSRAQLLAMMTRATNSVEQGTSASYAKTISQLESSVGESIYNESVAPSLDYSYLTTEDGSLNSDTYNSSVSRGEAIYTIFEAVYGSGAGMVMADIDSAVLSDATNGGDIMSDQNLSSKAQEISYAISNPDGGCPEDIYRALVRANELGIISDETAWDEAITLSDVISIYYDIAVYKSGANTSTSTSNDGSTTTSVTTTTTIKESEGWSEYKETMDYYVSTGAISEELAYMLNPDIYGTVTYGKGTHDFSTGKVAADTNIKGYKLTTTKGYNIKAYYYVETGTVQFIYSGEVSPASGTWWIDEASDDALDAAYGNEDGISYALDITHQQKIDALGEPSMTAEEVIAALGY
jgi:hypothetical protein